MLYIVIYCYILLYVMLCIYCYICYVYIVIYVMYILLYIVISINIVTSSEWLIVVSVSESYAVSCGFAPWLGHTKTIIKMYKLPSWLARSCYGKNLAVQPFW